MGLAASQARLLTITARLADNELRSQTINNAKMRLATQSAQASDEYVSALNNAQMMFSNVGTDGLAQKQALTFNALTQYSQYNTQYGIVNSAGMIMVSEEDAAIFKNTSNNLEAFLKAHGLEWETTFFSDSSGNLSKKIQDFYGTGSYKYLGDLFSGMSNDDLKQLYLDSLSEDASIEKLNYEQAAQNYYTEVLSLYKNAAPEMRQEILDTTNSNITEENVANAIAGLDNAAKVKRELLSGNLYGNDPINDDIDNGAKFALNYLTSKNYLNTGYEVLLRKKVSSLTDSARRPGYAGLATEQTQISGPTSPTVTYTNSNGDEVSISGGTSYTFGGNPTFTITFDVPTLSDPEHKTIKDADGKVIREYDWQRVTGRHNEITSSDSSMILPNVNEITEDSWNSNPSTRASVIDQIYTDSSTGTIEYRYVNIYEDDKNHTPDYYVCKVPIGTNSTKDRVYKQLADWYLEYVLDTEAAFNYYGYAAENKDCPTLKGYNDSIADFGVYGVSVSIPKEANCLVDYNEMVKQKGLTRNGVNPYMKSVLDSFMADLMLDVLGEPKYAWVDKSDPENIGNADSKAQWLTNLFNRMQKGYKVLENGLAKSQEWLEYAFESGLVSMEQVDLSQNWVSMDYKSCSNIYEETDNSATVSKAEAKYNRAMNDIKQKDSMFDLQLKNIDTEHSALQTEYDVIKGVMNKNIERTMKFDQNG
ncbi:hypothetical protein IJ674_04145 [bacterium]|nr:hypothetical protein [bacterium]